MQDVSNDGFGCPTHGVTLVWWRKLRVTEYSSDNEVACCYACGTPFHPGYRKLQAEQKSEPVTIRSFAVYREKASRTDADMPLEYYALGLAGEAGEVVDALKKYLYHEREDCKEKAIEELGDLMWFVDRTAAKLGKTLEEVTSKNAAKLQARYPNGWDLDIARVKR